MTQKLYKTEKIQVNIPTTIPYWLIFLLLTFLCYQAHELFHHVLGAVLCGGFGKMTFGVFVTRPQCAWENVVTLAGPMISFAIAWAGMYMLSRHKHILFAYTLIFASFAHLRFMLLLGKSGDEWLLARIYLQQPNQYLLAGIVLLLGLPPLVYTFKSISNKRRMLVFVISWLMPLLILTLVSIVDDRLFASDPANVNLALAGVPVIVLVTNLAAVVLFILVGAKILNQPETAGGIMP